MAGTLYVVMKKTLATVAGTAAIIGIGLTAGTVVASAQDDPPSSPPTTVSVPAEPGGDATAPEGETEPERKTDDRRHDKHGAKFEALEELGLTIDMVRAGRQEGQTLAEIAEANGVSTDALVAALTAQAQARLDAAVEQGKLTADEAAETDLEAKITEYVNAAPTDRSNKGGRHHGRGGSASGEAKGHGTNEALLDYLALSAEEIRAARADGQTLAQMAEAAGKSVDGLIDALIGDRLAAIDAKVADGSLDAERAAAMTERLTERATDMVNGEHTNRRGHHRAKPLGA